MGNTQLQVKSYRLIESAVTSKEAGHSVESGGLFKKKAFQPYSLGGNSTRGGLVCPAVATNVKQPVCMKVLMKNKKLAHQVKEFAREAGILSLCSHPNVVKFLDVFQDDNRLYLVQELGTHGNMYTKHIARLDGNEELKPMEVVQSLFRQLVDGLEYLHQQKIAHMDIKPQNVVCTDESTVKFCDFGESKLLGEEESAAMWQASESSALLGTYYYIDPEARLRVAEAMSSSSANAKTKIAVRPYDVFAFGCLLFELMTGKLAFPKHNTLNALDPAYEHIKDNYREESPADRWPSKVGNFPAYEQMAEVYGEESVLLLLDMWHPLAEDRVNVRKIKRSALYKLNHELAKGVELKFTLDEALLALLAQMQKVDKETNMVEFDVSEKSLPHYSAKKEKLKEDEKDELSQYEGVLKMRSAMESLLPEYHDQAHCLATTFSLILSPDELVREIVDTLEKDKFVDEMEKKLGMALEYELDETGYGVMCTVNRVEEEEIGAEEAELRARVRAQMEEEGACVFASACAFEILLYSREGDKEKFVEFKNTGMDERMTLEVYRVFKQVFDEVDKGYAEPEFVDESMESILIYA